MKTTVVNVRHHEFDVYIGRRINTPRCRFMASKWANPHKVGPGCTLKQSLQRYETDTRNNPVLMAALPELVGKRLGCWDVKEPISEVQANPVCHGEILLKLLQEMKSKEQKNV